MVIFPEGSPLMSVDQKDYTRLQVDDKEVTLIGTAHISQDSVDTVINAIEEFLPDTVCVELDHQRYQSLINQKGWESLDLKAVIKKKQLPFLLANLALSSYQKTDGSTDRRKTRGRTRRGRPDR